VKKDAGPKFFPQCQLSYFWGFKLMKHMQVFAWGHRGRYHSFGPHFRKLFGGEKVQKISIEAGFTCPNRDGTRGKGGCTYCNNAAFSPGMTEERRPVSRQMEEGIAFFAHKYAGMKYLAYFQSYSNTYAPVERLRTLYREALACQGVVGLVIATRPDCLGEETLDYLAELSEKYYIMLELGVESHLDRTLREINRGHTFGESVMALEKAAARKLRTTAHMILGLPGENHREILEQAAVISQLPVDNLKLHQLQIHKGTALAAQYRKNPSRFHLFTADAYASLVVDYLERLNPAITVERFTSQAPASLLVAPSWGIKNHVFTHMVEKLLEERNTFQGARYGIGSRESGIWNRES